MRPSHTPAQSANTRNEPHPVCEKNEDENRCKKPECLLDQRGPNNSFKELVKTFNKPLEEVLCSGGNQLHFSGRQLREKYESQSDAPGYDHRVGNREWSNVENFDGVCRKLVFGRPVCRCFTGSGNAGLMPRSSTVISAPAQQWHQQQSYE